ncbi:hypothetical protein COU97_01950 [Candidatus Shapirobacteria bacterium CG10_big_fil_rev_8_21_14_0_10_48_15]|uniref:Methyltransferase domain-containing protein n=1 Tax=Candidatus Shapirobacteria bacterium CG10_big_fil_rev_8_21_14_0_10_48_15 TaxID=1974484 RepID=A0A2M8L6Z3_9BACT|nr:MAG: hypothetical protein COU97_01950 [Candidatus Shapirobacteria bacterium CG10_big_fil_rev_8_21_14_0_10_48_15]
MKSQKKYWETKIINWEKTIYSSKKLAPQSLVEKMAAPFRKILKKRLAAAEKLVSRHAKGKIIADLGCGSGIFLKKMAKYQPKKLIGVDIALSAIEAAQSGCQGRRYHFVCTDLRRDTGPVKNAHIVVGIGFIDYFAKDELVGLFGTLKNKQFLFSFPEKIFSLREILHRAYLILAACPGSNKYSRQEMDAILKKAGLQKWWYYDQDNIRFVTNLPHRTN